MSPAMSVEEREQLIAGVHVGVLSVVAGDGRGPLAVPVWYHGAAGVRCWLDGRVRRVPAVR